MCVFPFHTRANTHTHKKSIVSVHSTQTLRKFTHYHIRNMGNSLNAIINISMVKLDQYPSFKKKKWLWLEVQIIQVI